jgi:hypothetical protein
MSCSADLSSFPKKKADRSIIGAVNDLARKAASFGRTLWPFDGIPIPLELSLSFRVIFNLREAHSIGFGNVTAENIEARHREFLGLMLSSAAILRLSTAQGDYTR